jgi:hypothetical protein
MNICFNELINKIIYYINDNNNLLLKNDNEIFEYILSKFTSKHVDIGFLSEDIFNIDVNQINLLNQSPIFKYQTYIKNTYKLRAEIFNKFDDYLRLAIDILKTDNTAIRFKEIFIPSLAKNNNKISVDYVISYLHSTNYFYSNDEFKSEIHEELAMNNNDSAVNYMISYLNYNTNQKVFEIFARNSNHQAVNFILVSFKGCYFSSKYKITQVFWQYLASNDNNDATNYLIKNIDKIEFTDKFKK